MGFFLALYLNYYKIKKKNSSAWYTVGVRINKKNWGHVKGSFNLQRQFENISPYWT